MAIRNLTIIYIYVDCNISFFFIYYYYKNDCAMMEDKIGKVFDLKIFDINIESVKEVFFLSRICLGCSK